MITKLTEAFNTRVTEFMALPRDEKLLHAGGWALRPVPLALIATSLYLSRNADTVFDAFQCLCAGMGIGALSFVLPLTAKVKKLRREIAADEAAQAQTPTAPKP